MSSEKDKIKKKFSKENNIFLKNNNVLCALKLKKKKYKKKLFNINQRNEILLKNFNTKIYKKSELICKFSLEKIIVSILPILDSLEKAAESIKNSIEYKKIYKKLLKNNSFLLKIFLDNHIKIIKEENVLFNPSIHQAIFLIKSEKVKKNYVVQVIQKGYLLHNRLLRAAMVSVSN